MRSMDSGVVRTGARTGPAYSPKVLYSAGTPRWVPLLQAAGRRAEVGSYAQGKDVITARKVLTLE